MDSFYGTKEEGAVEPNSVTACFDMFSESSLVVSSSYHGCVFAAIHGVPFVPLKSVTGKTEQFAVECYGGYGCPSGDWPSWMDEVRRRLKESMGRFRNRFWLNVPGCRLKDFTLQVPAEGASWDCVRGGVEGL